MANYFFGFFRHPAESFWGKMTLLFIFVRNIVVKMGLVQPPFWEVWKVSFGLKKGEYIGSTDHDSSELMAFIQVGLNTRLFCTREKDSLPHKVPG